MSGGLVLSLFPGIGLLDRAFEAVGFCVVRGPDWLWGGDVRSFAPPRGCWSGVIGGPPCQLFSSASNLGGTGAIDLIPEFVRVVAEAAPQWVVMENVRGAVGHDAIPRAWHPAKLRDWDCGGLTNRTRYFWTWPFMVMEPARRPGRPSRSVMASTWKRGSGEAPGHAGFLRGDLPIEEYARLQGAEDVGRRLVESRASRAFAVRVLGNGVPYALGRHVADAAARYSQSHDGRVAC